MKQHLWNRLDLVFFLPFEVTSMHKFKSTVLYPSYLCLANMISSAKRDF